MPNWVEMFSNKVRDTKSKKTKGRRDNLSKIIELIKSLFGKLTSSFYWKKRKFFQKKEKIEIKGIIGKREKKIKRVSEVSHPVKSEEKPDEQKKESPEGEKAGEKAPIEEKKEEPEEEKDEERPKNDRKIKEQEKTPKEVLKKPYIVKPPTEEREEKQRKPTISKEKAISKGREIIDLGGVRKRKYKRIIQPSLEDEKIIKESKKEKPEEKEIQTRIVRPSMEIDLDESKIWLVLPQKQLKINESEKVPSQLIFKLAINQEDKKEIAVKVKAINRRLAQTVEKRIQLEVPLKSFNLIFADELGGKEFIYEHKNDCLYTFVAMGNNQGKMHELYDSKGNLNPLPKRKIWILLDENFEIKTGRVIVEAEWIWNKFKPFLVDLRQSENLIIKSKRNDIVKKLPCSRGFSLKGEKIIKDDFEDESPLFIGKTLRIKAPRENPIGWSVWIQHRQAGFRVVTRDWKGIEELKLNLPDDLSLRYGEFQIDIRKMEASIAAETLFFRWIDFIELKYPKMLIIPDSVQGGKIEYIEIKLENLEEWDFKSKESLRKMVLENNVCRVEVLPEIDVVHLSIAKKNNPENKLKLRITIPRLKWHLSSESFWRDRAQKIERDFLNLGDLLIVRTNDLKTNYDLIVTLESRGEELQTYKFVQKGIDYFTDLGQFRDTIKSNKEDLSFKVKVVKDSKLLGTIETLMLPKKVELQKKKLKENIKHMKKIGETPKLLKIYPLVKCSRKWKKGKGFSKAEVMEAGLNLDDIKRLNISCDKRRKSLHSINIETLKKIKRGN